MDTGWYSSNESYMQRVKEEFFERAADFRPDMILHNLGHDTCRGDYGDRADVAEYIFPRIIKILAGGDSY